MSLSKVDFDLWQQAVGIVYNKHALIFDRRLSVQPISMFLHDWMHCFLVHGIFQAILFWVLVAAEEALGKGADIYAEISSYLEHWHTPASKPGKMQNLFTNKRKVANKKAHAFKCTASEALMLLHVLAFYFQEVLCPAHIAEQECQAFILLFKVLDTIQAVPHGQVQPHFLKIAIKNFLDQCLACGWRNQMFTKFHWTIHMASHLEHFKILPSCFVQERKHKTIKRYSNNILNTRAFEQSILEEIATHDLFQLEEDGLFDMCFKLQKLSKPSKALSKFIEDSFENDILSCYACSALVLPYGGTCQKGDICMLTSKQAAQVWAHAQINGVLVSLVSCWDLLSYNSEQGQAVFEKQDQPLWISSSDIMGPVTWSNTNGNQYRVLLPYSMRW